MIQLQALDSEVLIQAQLGAQASPVVLVNIFRFAPEDEAALVQAWEHDANWMKQQPGYISTQLHRAVGDSVMFMNYAVWESVAHFAAAFAHPDFHRALGAQASQQLRAAPFGRYPDDRQLLTTDPRGNVCRRTGPF